MTPFTDNNLKRLKENLADLNVTYMDSAASADNIRALLARLEAAEKALYLANEWIRGGVAGGDITYAYFDSNYEVWRKASGKAGDSAESGAGK